MKEKNQGKSIKKKLLQLLKYALFVLVGLPLAFSLLFKQPFVQSMAARRLADMLSAKTHVQVKLRSVEVDVFKGFQVNGLNITDSLGSPMVHIGKLRARISLENLLRARFLFRSVLIDTLDFRLLDHKKADNYAFVKFINRLSSSKSKQGHSSRPFIMHIKRLVLNQVHFQLKDENVHNVIAANSMNYEDLEVNNAAIRVHDFHVVNDSLNFFLDNLKASEKSGFLIRKLSAHIVISGKAFYFKNFVAETNHSNIAMDYTMDAAGWNSYSYFVDSVNLHADFRTSSLDLSDIGYFANSLFPMTDTIQVMKANVKGTISNLIGRHLSIRYGKKTHFMGDLTIKGLPDFYASHIQAKIRKFSTSTRDVNAFMLPIDSMPHIPLPARFPKEEVIVHGDFEGTPYDFVTNLAMQTADKGSLEMKAGLKATANKLIRFKVILSGKQFPLGRWLAMPSLIGRGNFQAQIISGQDQAQGLPLEINMNFKRLDLNTYPYKNIIFNGLLVNDSLYANLNVADPHLVLKSKGYVLLKKHPFFKLSLQLAKADFKNLNIWTQKDFHLQTTANIQWQGLNPDSLLAHVEMTDSRLQFGDDSYPVKQVLFDKYIDTTGENVIQLQSDILGLKMRGHYALSSVGTSIEQLINHYFPVFEPLQLAKNKQTRDINLRLELYRPEIIGEHFVRGLSISPNTWFSGHFNFLQDSLKADAYSKKLQYHGIDFKENHLHLRTDLAKLSLKYQFLHLILKDSTPEDKSVFGLDSVQLAMGMRNDSLDVGLRWNNQDSTLQNSGDLRGFYVKNKRSEKMRITRSDVIINDSLWQLDPRNSIRHDDLGWQFNHFLIRGGHSQLALEGRYPKLEGDSLNIAFRQWNLSNLNMLWRSLGFDLDGTIDGNISSTMIGGRNARVANLTIDKLALNHIILGSARVLSAWDNVNNSAFIKTQIIRQGNSFKGKIFSLDGFYYPYRDSANLDMKVSLNHFELKSINPFISEYISQLKGVANGELNLLGTTANPTLTGFVNLKRTSLVVNYLNTRYSFEQKLVFHNNYIDFGHISLYDTLGNHGILSGKLFHRHFHDARIDLEVNTNRLLFFNTNRNQNDLYYGQAIASGKLSITGPLNNIQLNIDAESEKGTSVILPLDYSTEIPDKDYIVFKPPKTDSSQLHPTETVLNLPLQRKSKYAINLNMGINPNAKLKIYLPSNIGDLESAGSGALSLKTNSDGDLSLSGDYIVDHGAFNFSLANLVKKHFELVKGGRISWTGDPYKASVNIKGLYKVKVNLSSLGILIDSTTSFRNRVNVDCYVVMTKDLFNPDIRFEIKFPNLDPDLQRMVFSQIDTSNQAVMNQQMISLLILGSFNFNNPNIASLSSTSYSLLSNQLSGMLSKISKDFDIGLNYKSGDNLSQEEFEVALSTQLFDNRLMINGNFGMSYDRQNRSASNLVGDVDVGYKLTKDGRWLLKAYNHSNVNSWYYYNNYDKVSPYTQGVGIAYQTEFNKLADIFAKKRKRKKRTKSSQ